MSDSSSLRSQASTPVRVNTVRWEKASNGIVPTGAVCGGKTLSGEPLFVGRMKLRENKDELTPGVIIPSEKCLYASFGTGVKYSADYEVLVTEDPSHASWIACKDGYVPPTAVIGGIDSSYLEPLYVGRTNYNQSIGRTWRGQRFPYCHQEVSVPGKVQRSHKCLYIPFEKKEYIFRHYDVLALTSSPAALVDICIHSIQKHLMDMTYNGNESRPGSQTSGDLPNSDEDVLEQKIKQLPIPVKLQKLCLG